MNSRTIIKTAIVTIGYSKRGLAKDIEVNGGISTDHSRLNRIPHDNRGLTETTISTLVSTGERNCILTTIRAVECIWLQRQVRQCTVICTTIINLGRRYRNGTKGI